MKKYISVLLAIVCMLSFMACSKKDTYEIEIIVPAGSQEEFVYSEEEIMATGNQITIYSGAGLGDTEVILKPVNETLEAGYVGEYLTHGMPVKLDAVKGEWFKVGVAVQNDSERDSIAVSVEIEGVEVRIAESIEPEEKDISSEEIALLTDTFWKSITNIVYYDFNEDIYELSDAEKLEELQAIFTEMTYKEIENPWLEGWYLFEIHTKEKIYDMSITGDIISFDGKIYEVTDSIAKEVTEIIKLESVPKEWTEQEYQNYLKQKQMRIVR